ncbi:hypothetical protein I7I53_06033 [Histoplasma capsulatum var. duboisii H88]|uniref:Uncharacterized protein n=1 Tax=Ajellomyces capsulatus (strain H88) TaxID=544711 RepID=A0A8A1LDD5_AJEC8|nr:hypothetical protein I7I53_06033 [Histoplasma capsulatum var. duboisii H88]
MKFVDLAPSILPPHRRTGTGATPNQPKKKKKKKKKNEVTNSGERKGDPIDFVPLIQCIYTHFVAKLLESA